MNLTTPFLNVAAHAAELPGDSVASFLKMVGDSTGLFDDSPDGLLGSHWRLNWERRLVRSGTNAMVLDLGHVRTFELDGSGQRFRSAVGDTLAFTADRAVWTMPDGTTEVFDTEGRLIERTDAAVMESPSASVALASTPLAADTLNEPLRLTVYALTAPTTGAALLTSPALMLVKASPLLRRNGACQTNR